MLQKNILPILLAVCIAFIFSCEPEEQPVIPEKWERVRGFEEGLFDAREINGKLYTASWTRIYPDASLQGPNNFVDLSPFLGAMAPYKVPISDQLIAVKSPTRITILPSDDPNAENALVLNMKDIDAEFLEFNFGGNSKDDELVIYPDGGIIVPYRSKNEGGIKNTPDFLWVKTGIDAGKVVLLETKLIKEEHFDRSVVVNNMKGFENFTRVSIGDKTFDIDRVGNMELRFEQQSKSVQVGEDIFTFTITSPFENTFYRVYKSDLSGKNNQLIGTYASSNIAKWDNIVFSETLSSLYSVNGIILLQSAWSIYKLSMDGQRFALTELENNGLENGNITSITLLSDSSVLVTAICSDNGVFYNCGGFSKSLENFFNPKENIPQR